MVRRLGRVLSHLAAANRLANDLQQRVRRDLFRVARITYFHFSVEGRVLP